MQWIFAKSYGVLIFFAIIVGTVSGTLVGPPLTSRLFMSLTKPQILGYYRSSGSRGCRPSDSTFRSLNRLASLSIAMHIRRANRARTANHIRGYLLACPDFHWLHVFRCSLMYVVLASVEDQRAREASGDEGAKRARDT